MTTNDKTIPCLTLKERKEEFLIMYTFYPKIYSHILLKFGKLNESEYVLAMLNALYYLKENPHDRDMAEFFIGL